MNPKLEKWNEWFAGVIDGDGYFYINEKEQRISFEVTTHITDYRILADIKNNLKGGSIKNRSHSKSFRYRVKQKQIILQILNRINGKLHNKKRLEQFKKACQMLNVQFIPSDIFIDNKSAFLVGLIDSDGSISISVSNSNSQNSIIPGQEGKILRLVNSKGFHQLSLKITSVDEDFISRIQESYGFGTVYEEKESVKNKSPKRKYHWTIRSQEEFFFLSEILKKYPLKGIKNHRIRLVRCYFSYKTLKYHLAEPGTQQFNIWKKFCKSWYKYEI